MQSTDRWNEGANCLIDVVKASQVDSMGAEIADVEHRVFHWLKLQRQTVLNAIGLFVVLGKTSDCRGTKKASRRRIGGVRVIAGDQVVEDLRHSGRTGATRNQRAIAEQLGHRIQVIFRVLASREL